MNLYDEKEHVISSDEYSDDDDDALMNDAVRAQDYNNRTCNYTDRNIQPKWRIDQKQKELSSLIRRNKISVIYKNKSIKWLNNKKQREQYKDHFFNTKKSNINQVIPSAVADPEEEKITNAKLEESKYDIIQDVVSIEDEETEYSIKSSNQEIVDKKELLQKGSTLDLNNEAIIQREKDSYISNENLPIVEDNKQLKKEINKTSEKRMRSPSPSLLSEGNGNEIKQNEKKTRIESPQFYKSINDMFTNFDTIATNHIDTIGSSTLTATNEKMKCLSNEIDTLNDILHTKEMEWNRLLHLKLVKEEIYSRLSQKRQLLQLNDRYAKNQGNSSLLELKELEIFLSDRQKPNASDNNHSSITIQKLIENRANMNSKDLEREKNNTSRLHSLLVSQNMLHGQDFSGNTSDISNGEKTVMGITNKNTEFFNHTDGGFTNRGRQKEFRDVKSIIADFRQRNPEVLPRVGKRIKSSESKLQHDNFSIPYFGKNSSGLHCLAKDHPAEFYTLQNSVEGVSINPMERAKKLSLNHDNNFVNTMPNNYIIGSEEKYLKSQAKKDFDRKCPKNIQYPLCQECKSKESRFVCAGCGNQWYCSKKCQISAWDKHSELCTE